MSFSPGRNRFVQGHNNNRHLSTDEIDHNIGGLPVSEPALRELFDKYDTTKSGYLEFNEVKKIYKSFENFGLEPNDKEVEGWIRRFAKSADNVVSFDEFCCLILSIAQR